MEADPQDPLPDEDAAQEITPDQPETQDTPIDSKNPEEEQAFEENPENPAEGSPEEEQAQYNPEEEQQSEKEDIYKSTFATTTEGLDILIHDDIESPKKVIDPLRKEFQTKLKDGEYTPPKRKSQPIKTIPFRTSSGPPLLQSEVETICDNLLKGKPLKTDDPTAVSQILDELNKRRLEALNANEYMKAKKIEEVIQNVKLQYRQKDRTTLYNDHKQALEEKYQHALNQLDETKKKWKELEKEKEEQFKEEQLMLRRKQEDQLEELEGKWTDPSTQRKFTKRSAQLLHSQAIEKYAAISGDLETAEAYKKSNQKAEKMEITDKFNKLKESYEHALISLQNEQEAETKKLLDEQKLRKAIFLTEQQAAIDSAQKRVATTKKDLDDIGDMDRYIAKKFRVSTGRIVPLSAMSPNIEELPPLQTKQRTTRSENDGLQTTVTEVSPLTLPPLKLKKKKKNHV